jgi:F-box-like
MEVMPSPIRQLPVELLANIFILACHEQFIEIVSPSADRAGLASGSTAIVLSRVCRQWRSVSTSTHVIWTRLDLQCSGARVHSRYSDASKQADSASDPHPSRFMKTILRRSGSRSLQFKACHPNSSDPAFAPCVCSVVINRNHLRTLSLKLDQYDLGLLLQTPSSFPCLEHISLTACAVLTKVGLHSPRLTSLALRDQGVWLLRLDQLEVSWASLTTLSVFRDYHPLAQWVDFLAALGQATALTVLRFNLAYTIPPTALNPVRLPSLRTLAIQDEDQDLLHERTLELFHVPSLERFDYCTGYDLVHSSATARELDILSTWLSSLPKLQLFQLGYMEDSFFDAPYNVPANQEVFYLVPPSPASAFVSLSERMFGSRLASTPGQEVEGIALLSDATVQCRSPVQDFRAEEGGVNDVFEMVNGKTIPILHHTSRSQNFVPDTALDVKLCLDLLSVDTYKGARSFLLHVPVSG